MSDKLIKRAESFLSGGPDPDDNDVVHHDAPMRYLISGLYKRIIALKADNERLLDLESELGMALCKEMAENERIRDILNRRDAELANAMDRIEYLEKTV